MLGAVVSWLTGRGFGRWLFAAAALLAISGVTRLIEFWITNGTGGVTYRTKTRNHNGQAVCNRPEDHTAACHNISAKNELRE